VALMRDNFGASILVDATVRFIDEYMVDADPLSFCPRDLFLALTGKARRMVESGEECRADEFFELYVDALGQQIRAHMEHADLDTAAKRFRATWLFGGEQVVVRRLNSGSTKSRTIRPFHALRVSIKYNDIITLEDALRQWNPSRTEVIPSGMSEQTYIRTPPQNLVVVIERFDRHGYLGTTESVSYPLTLILPPEILARETGGSVAYTLHAVIHYLDYNEPGRHTVDVLNSENTWVRIDDYGTEVVEVDTVLLDDYPISAYMLFYQRAEVPILATQ